MMISRGSGVSLEIFVVFGQGRVLGFIVLLLHAHLPLGVHLDLWGQQSRHRDELEVRVADQLSRQPQERLLKVVVRLGRDVVVLKKKSDQNGHYKANLYGRLPSTDKQAKKN